MIRQHKNSAGFSVVEALLILVVLAALAFVGFTFAGKQKNVNKTASTPQTTQNVSTSEEVSSDGEDLVGSSADDAADAADAASVNQTGEN